MITDLNKILVEWSYRTSDGKPDVKNSAKLLILESVLNDFGWSREARAELLNNLMEAGTSQYDSVADGRAKAQPGEKWQVALDKGGRGKIYTGPGGKEGEDKDVSKKTKQKHILISFISDTSYGAILNKCL